MSSINTRLAAIVDLIKQYNVEERTRVNSLTALGWKEITYYPDDGDMFTYLFAPHINTEEFPFFKGCELGLFDTTIRYEMTLQAKELGVKMTVEEYCKPFPQAFFKEDEYTLIELYE